MSSKTKNNYEAIRSESDSDLSTNGKHWSAKRIPALGIILTILSVIVYSLGSAIVNLLPELHSIEILVIRAFFQMVYYGCVTLIQGYSIRPAESRNWELALRCISGTITQCTVFVAYRWMPLADATTIQFSSPVFVALFSFFMLKESLTLLHGIAGVVTLIGVVVIAQPEFIFGAQDNTIYDNRIWGTLLAVVSSITWALSIISLRRLKSTPVAVIVSWYSLLMMVVGIVVLLILDELVVPIGWYTWGILIAVAVCGIADQYFISKALQYESAGPVSVIKTSTVVMTFIWEAVILGQTIEYLSIIGASLVTVCVLVLAVDKWRKESPKTFERFHTCCAVSDDYYDSEEHKINPSDSLHVSYNSTDEIERKDTTESICDPLVVVEANEDTFNKNKNDCEVK